MVFHPIPSHYALWATDWIHLSSGNAGAAWRCSCPPPSPPARQLTRDQPEQKMVLELWLLPALDCSSYPFGSGKGDNRKRATARAQPLSLPETGWRELRLQRLHEALAATDLTVIQLHVVSHRKHLVLRPISLCQTHTLSSTNTSPASAPQCPRSGGNKLAGRGSAPWVGMEGNGPKELTCVVLGMLSALLSMVAC